MNRESKVEEKPDAEDMPDDGPLTESEKKRVPAAAAGPISPLVHIGYHKTASTWLQRHFFKRKDIGSYWIKADLKFHNVHPLHFSADDYRAHYHPKLLEAGVERVPVISNERLSGHPHSGGFDSKEIADRLKAVFPEARILMVIREQRGAILSSWYQYVKKGGTGSLKNYLRPRGDGHVPLFHRDHFSYDGLIAYYQDLFGKDRVKVLPFEWFLKEPMDYLREVADFGGFKLPAGLPLGWKSNKAAPPVKVLLRSRLNLLIRRDTVNECSPYATWLGAGIFLPLIELAGRLTPEATNQRFKKRWRRFVEKEFGNHFAASNRRTEELTGLDLAPYGYDRHAEDQGRPNEGEKQQ
ncbi:MAG: sulfotransferase [Sphingomonadales bacterium]